MIFVSTSHVIGKSDERYKQFFHHKFLLYPSFIRKSVPFHLRVEKRRNGQFPITAAAR